MMLNAQQIDFHEGGSLAVPGSTEDAKRIARMIMLENLFYFLSLNFIINTTVSGIIWMILEKYL